MIILTGASHSYRNSVDGIVGAALRFGYDPLIYDLGELGMGLPYHVAPIPPGNGYQPKSPFKPALIGEALHWAYELCLYVDADTELRRPVDELDTRDYDVGVTIFPEIHPERHRYPAVTGYLNAGVVALYPTARGFVSAWQAALADTETGSDQEALTRLLLAERPCWTVGEVFKCHGARVKFLNADIYNSIHLLPEAAIWHRHGDKQRDLIGGIQ